MVLLKSRIDFKGIITVAILVATLWIFCLSLAVIGSLYLIFEGWDG